MTGLQRDNGPVHYGPKDRDHADRSLQAHDIEHNDDRNQRSIRLDDTPRRKRPFDQLKTPF